jgi:hypothetical protein
VSAPCPAPSTLADRRALLRNFNYDIILSRIAFRLAHLRCVTLFLPLQLQQDLRHSLAQRRQRRIDQRTVTRSCTDLGSSCGYNAIKLVSGTTLQNVGSHRHGRKGTCGELALVGICARQSVRVHSTGEPKEGAANVSVTGSVVDTQACISIHLVIAREPGVELAPHVMLWLRRWCRLCSNVLLLQF